MEWTRNFLRQLEKELEKDVEESRILEAEGNNPDTLRMLFSTGDDEDDLAVMDVAVYPSKQGLQFLNFYTVIVPEVQPKAVPGLLEHLNRLNLPVPLGAFGYFEEDGQVYHKYSLIVEEPADMDRFVAGAVSVIALILGFIENYGEEIDEASGLDA